jgi:hypothetical protein
MMVDTADHGKITNQNLISEDKKNINEMQQSIPTVTIAQHSCSISLISPELLEICTNKS